MNRTVTVEQLKRLGACKETLDFLRDRFGETVAITEENAVACAAEISWEWAAGNLLPSPLRQQCLDVVDALWQQYEEAEAPLRQQYLEAVAPLRQQYEEAKAPLRQQYLEAVAPLRQQYEEAKAPLWQQYREAKAPLWQQYRESCARLFVSLYNQVEE